MRVDDLVGSDVVVTFGADENAYMCGKLEEVLDDGTLRVVTGRPNKQYHFFHSYIYISVYEADIKQELKR